jgi:tetratricopeptide (TPR) repeat protein
MIPSRLLGPPILRVPLAIVLVISAVLGASTAWAQGQPPGSVPAPKLSEAERAQQLQERDQIKAELMRLAQAGKLDEAVAAAEKELAVSREVRGELHEDVVGSLGFLARLQEARENWAAARNALTEVIDIRQRQPAGKDWRIADARRAVVDLGQRAAFNPAQRQQLQEADRLNRLQDALYKRGKYAEGIDPCRKAMEIRGKLLGENHRDYAGSLNNLALLYWAMGDNAKAEPLYRQALEIRKRVLGENHPDYAQSLNNLAALQYAMGVSVLYWTLGAALGVLLHIVLFPASIVHIFPPGERKDSFLADATRKPMVGFLSSSGATTAGAAGPEERSFDSQSVEQVAG